MKPHIDGSAVASRPERRTDQIMADVVEVGLLFVDVFGGNCGLSFFACTIVAPHVYHRVLSGRYRRPQLPDGPGDPAFAG